MKIRLKSASGYVGLKNVKFPVEVQVQSKGYQLYYVSYEEMSKVEGWFFHERDTEEGSFYCFYFNEVDVVGDESSLEDASVQENVQQAEHHEENVNDVLPENSRKNLLLQLISEYGEAVKDSSDIGDYGFLDSLAYATCKVEEERLLNEITKMIEEGV